jgi:anhydro-N-acetylmuramic acid kinase
MSGTSLDGVDAALIETSGTGEDLSVSVLGFLSEPYSDQERGRIESVMANGSLSELVRLDRDLGKRFASVGSKLLRELGCSPSSVAVVGSHGQTLYHDPPTAEGVCGSTLQVGCAARIRENLGIKVVSDFRSADMAAGGQGAPLVPMVDWMLFRRSDGKPRALLNVGGMANVTRVLLEKSETIAFDTGPGNVLIDLAARAATGSRLSFDVDGELGAKGCVHEALLNDWLADPYFEKSPPKSTGREYFGPEYFRARGQEAERFGVSADDLVATFTAFTARSIARSLKRWIFPLEDVLVSGGGARNPTLMRGIERELEGVRVGTSQELSWPVDAKEAIAFAILALLHLDRVPGNLPRVTGARHPVVLGRRTG